MPFEAISLGEYPELRKLAWNRAPGSVLTPAEAFGLYEREWRHVDTEALGQAERDLIRALIETIGQGVFNV